MTHRLPPGSVALGVGVEKARALAHRSEPGSVALGVGVEKACAIAHRLLPQPGLYR